MYHASGNVSNGEPKQWKGANEVVNEMKTLLYIHRREDDAKKGIAPYCSEVQFEKAVRIRKKAILDLKENQKRKKYQEMKKICEEGTNKKQNCVKWPK